MINIREYDVSHLDSIANEVRIRVKGEVTVLVDDTLATFLICNYFTIKVSISVGTLADYSFRDINDKCIAVMIVELYIEEVKKHFLK